MKPFFYTTIAAFALLIFTALTISVLRVEKQKTQIETYTSDIDSLTNELQTYQVMYLKCAGNIEAEKYGAHYSDGKLKFYRMK